jgi:hypothetical protein
MLVTGFGYQQYIMTFVNAARMLQSRHVLERPHRSAIAMIITIKYPCHSDFARYFMVMAKKVARSGQSRHNHKRIFMVMFMAAINQAGLWRIFTEP